MLEVRSRDVRARVAKWTAAEGIEIQTPELIVPVTSAGVPDWAAVTLSAKPSATPQTPGRVELLSGGTWFYPTAQEGQFVVPAICPTPTAKVQVIPVGDDLAVWHDAGGWANNSRNVVAALPDARAQATAGRLLWAPGLGTPADYAVWASLGIDLFDASPLLLAATRGEAWTVDGVLTGDAVQAVLGIDANDVDALTAHNLEAARAELRRIRHAITSGTLRALAERRAYNAPAGIELLRRFDSQHDYLESASPIMGGDMPCMTPEALWRPEVESFRRRVRDRYQPPAADVLVLLPCSARKPYGRSKSHRYFARALDDSGIRHRVHEVMLTSPLGIVPRELENCYPAANYDIPVTGRWSDDEQTIIRDQLASLLLAGNYSHVIAHVPSSTWSLIRDMLPEGSRHTAVSGAPQGIAGCAELLAELRRVGKDLPRSDPKLAGRARKLRDWHATASFQFGPAVADDLTDGCTARGKAPYVKLLAPGGDQRGMFTDKGSISLTLDGAQFLAKHQTKRVHIGDFWPNKTSSLFAVGVEDCDDDVRIGDQVVVVHNGEVRASGQALMSAEEMRALRRGTAVNMKHHAKPGKPVAAAPAAAPAASRAEEKPAAKPAAPDLEVNA